MLSLCVYHDLYTTSTTTSSLSKLLVAKRYERTTTFYEEENESECWNSRLFFVALTSQQDNFQSLSSLEMNGPRHRRLSVWPDDGVKSCLIFPSIAQKVA